MMVDGVGLLPPSQSIGKAFRNYKPAIDLFPMNLWARIAGRVLRRAPRTLYAQGNAAGFEPLRRAIAEYLGAARGVKCDAGQVIVTSGASRRWILRLASYLSPAIRHRSKIPVIPEQFSPYAPPEPTLFRSPSTRRA